MRAIQAKACGLSIMLRLNLLICALPHDPVAARHEQVLTQTACAVQQFA
jgi:hypothetical protein